MKHTKNVLLLLLILVAVLILPLVNAYAAEEDVMFALFSPGGNHNSAYQLLQFLNPNLTADDLKSEYITVTGDAEKDTNRGLDNGITLNQRDDGTFEARLYIKNAIPEPEDKYNIVFTHPTLGTYTSPDRLSYGSENGIYGQVLDEQGNPFIAPQDQGRYAGYSVRLTNSSGENILSGSQPWAGVNERDGTFDLGIIKGYEATDCVLSLCEAFTPKVVATKTIDTTKDNFDVVFVLGEGSVPEPVVDEPEVLAPVTPPAMPALNATPTASSVLVNGETVVFDAYNIADNNYFKLRDLAMVLSGTGKQFEVGFDGTNNAIALTSGKPYTSVGGELVAGDGKAKTAAPTTSQIYLDGAVVQFTAFNIGGNNYFKLRDIGMAFDFGVTWDGAANAIVIDTSTSYTPEVTSAPDTNISEQQETQVYTIENGYSITVPKSLETEQRGYYGTGAVDIRSDLWVMEWAYSSAFSTIEEGAEDDKLNRPTIEQYTYGNVTGVRGVSMLTEESPGASMMFHFYTFGGEYPMGWVRLSRSADYRSSFVEGAEGNITLEDILNDPQVKSILGSISAPK